MITTTDILYEGVRHVALHITAEAEAAENESAVLKLDVSNLNAQGTNPKETPTSVTLVKACWNTTFNFVRVLWDKTGSDQTMLVCAGDGHRCFESVGGKKAPSGDGTNNVLITTDGGADGDVYDIYLLFKLEF